MIWIMIPGPANEERLLSYLRAGLTVRMLQEGDIRPYSRWPFPRWDCGPEFSGDQGEGI